MSQRHSRLIFLFLAAFALLSVVPSFADSGARIVRLSTVEGNVEVDRNAGQGFEHAFLNLPITEGTSVRVTGDGRAEVEFEGGSTVRLTSGGVVEFPQLALRDSGAKATSVVVREGTAYVTFKGKQDDDFAVLFGDEKAQLSDPVHFRLEMNHSAAVLAVFKGELTVLDQSGSFEVGKKQSATFDLSPDRQEPYTISKKIEKSPFDEWDKHQDEYHDRYLSRNSYNSYSPYAYGVSDLNYYGSFFDAPGYGTLWQPYFVNAGWDPFMSGAWVFYPGSGYSWVSAYPWGWTPYHYGSWIQVPNRGWAWQPGGAWHRFPNPTNAPTSMTSFRAPTAPGRSTVVVNRGSFPTPARGSSFVIRNNSAGLGIPRGSLRNPSHVSQQVSQRGSVVARPAANPSSPSSSFGGSRPAAAASPAASPRMSSPRTSSPASSPRTSMPSSSPRGGTRPR